MKKILVPIDFSGHTEITCKYAMEIAHVYGAEIKLFHTFFDQIVVTNTNLPDTLEMNAIYNEELMKELQHQARRNMAELVKSMEQKIRDEKLGPIKIESEVVGGEVEHELKLVTRDYNPDLIVMGTTGKGNNINVWGKVSTFIIDHAKTPVITVPEIKGFLGFGNVMFAADLSDGNAAIIQTLLDSFNRFTFTLHVVHFLLPSKPGDAREKMVKLRHRFEDAIGSGRVRFEIAEVEADNQKSVDQFCRERSIDLIAFQPHKRSLFYMLFTRNITKKNLFATNIPLLAMPAV